MKTYIRFLTRKGFVPLIRAVGVKDEQIMKMIQMKSLIADANYCFAYEDCALCDLLRFTSTQSYAEHAQELLEKVRVWVELESFHSGNETEVDNLANE